MDDYAADDVQEALTPIASLISKSEKAQQKLAPGTWQHTMLQENLKALHHAFALMNDSAGASELTPDESREAVRAIDSMISRTEKSGAKFVEGTSQHSLQRNRLKALRIAKAMVAAELGTGGVESRGGCV